MARRRARAQKPAEVVEEEEEVMEEQEPEPEPELESEQEEQMEQDEGEEEPEHEENGENGEQQSLQFDEELSWRPAKPIATGTLIGRLDRLSKELAEFEQGQVDLDSLKDVAGKLGHRNLLQHKDRGVKAYTACCLVDMLRLFVPDAPFTDDQLKVRVSTYRAMLRTSLIQH